MNFIRDKYQFHYIACIYVVCLSTLILGMCDMVRVKQGSNSNTESTVQYRTTHAS